VLLTFTGIFEELVDLAEELFLLRWKTNEKEKRTRKKG
jgi:hypothetical protein